MFSLFLVINMQAESDETPWCLVIIPLKYHVSAGRQRGRSSRSSQRLRRCRREEILHVLSVGLFRAIFPGKQIPLSAIYHTCATQHDVCVARARQERESSLPPSPPSLCTHLSVFPLIRAYLLYLAADRDPRGPLTRGRSFTILADKDIYSLNRYYITLLTLKVTIKGSIDRSLIVFKWIVYLFFYFEFNN